MKKLAATIAAALVIAGCSTGTPSTPVSSPPSSTSWSQAEPGKHNVSTMEAGKEFEAEPNFFYFEGCGHPCDLGVYPSSNPATGTPSLTDRFPLEASADRPADRVQVMCQVTDGKQTANDTGAYSRVWDKVKIPAAHLTVDALADLPPDNTKFGYGWAPDIWLGNTGFHGLPCT